MATLPRYRILVGVTGASGSLYADFLIRALLAAGLRTYVIFTETARKVIATESSDSFLYALAQSKILNRLQSDEVLVKKAEEAGLTAQHLEELRIFQNDDLYAPVASGSEGATHMAIVPSSMGTLARIAHGMSGCLLERAADVMLKEKRTLLIVPRETPFNLIHLKNMTALVEAGAHLLPASPGFYQRPQTVDELVWFVVERILENLKLENVEFTRKVRWNIRLL
jgi:4-hydroxy-3-polyprenylbenzoate decarboxylase